MRVWSVSSPTGIVRGATDAGKIGSGFVRSKRRGQKLRFPRAVHSPPRAPPELQREQNISDNGGASPPVAKMTAPDQSVGFTPGKRTLDSPPFAAVWVHCSLGAVVLASNTTLPPTIVFITRTSRIVSGEMEKTSSLSRTMSANLPGVIEPFSFSWNSA